MRNKIVLKLVFNGLFGAAALFLVNLAGAALGFHLALNMVSIYIVGFLGVPGIVLLAILKNIVQ